MGTWLRNLAAVEPGRRKLTGLVFALLAALVVVLGCGGLLLLAPSGARDALVGVAQAGLVAITGLYAALCGGNAAEHRAARPAEVEGTSSARRAA